MIREVLKGYFTSLYSPEILILIGIAGIFFFQNLKETSLRKMILGESEDSPLVLSFKQLLFGLFGGGIVSLIAYWLHLEFYLYSEVQLVFLLTVFVLTSLSPYINVAINILIIFLAEILMGNSEVFMRNILPLYLLIGIMQLVQALILVIDRNFGFTPLLFAKGKIIIGGFRMNKSYFLPTSVGFFSMSGAILGQTIFYFLLYPMFSVKETFTGFNKKEAVYVMAGLKIIAGVLILLLGLGVSFNENLVYGLVLIGPFIIQGEVYFFRKIERSRQPRFVSTNQDVVVLEVKRTSPAYSAGLRSGHRVSALTRKPSPTYQELIYQVILANYPRQIDLSVKDEKNRAKTITLMIEENMNLGVLFVPPSESYGI
ncbi:MAG: hypothetical protein GX829_00880 [Clostridium sp.]|nr:hypothetical protein [Clostridium sp.]